MNKQISEKSIDKLYTKYIIENRIPKLYHIKDLKKKFLVAKMIKKDVEHLLKITDINYSDKIKEIIDLLDSEYYLEDAMQFMNVNGNEKCDINIKILNLKNKI